MKKYGFVYIWRDKKHNRYYIGSHWGSEDDGYICSSRWMRKSFRRRPNDFKRRIIAKVNKREDLLEEEQKWLNLIKEKEIKPNTKIPRYYNLCRSVKGHWSSDPYYSLSIREKISQKTKEGMANPEARKKYEKGLKKRDKSFRTPEWEKKRGKAISEGRNNLSENKKKEWYSKISKAKKGKDHHTEGTKWWTNGTDNKRSKERPGPKWFLGITRTQKEANNKGYKWWNDGNECKMSKESPGPQWIHGRF